MNGLASAQVTNSRLAFLSRPRAHLHEPEHALDDAEDMLDVAHFRLGAVLGPLNLIDPAFVTVAPVREVLFSRRMFANHVFLPLVGLVTPNLRLIGVQQVRQYRRVGDVGCSRYVGIRIRTQGANRSA